MQVQATLNRASDPSENFLNDLMVVGPKSIFELGKGTYALGKGIYDIGKRFFKSVGENGLKETGKRFAYQQEKDC